MNRKLFLFVTVLALLGMLLPGCVVPTLTPAPQPEAEAPSAAEAEAEAPPEAEAA